jgi:ABC-type polysaccharide/polyol phosphate export permease
MVEQLQALWSRRDLVKYFVRSDLKIIYRNKVLGLLWALLDPLMMMLVYILLVVVIFRRGSPQFPVLLFAALLAWHWFVNSLSSSVRAITGNAKLIQTVYFPKAVLPLSRVLVGLINFLLGLIVLVPLLLIFEAKFTFNLLWLPLLIFMQFLFTIGAALLCAALGVYARDLENILQFGLRIWFYLSPALYFISPGWRTFT